MSSFCEARNTVQVLVLLRMRLVVCLATVEADRLWGKVRGAKKYRGEKIEIMQNSRHFGIFEFAFSLKF